MKNRKIAPSCDSYLYAIYSMNYLLCIYFIINTKQSLVYEKLKIVPSCDSYLYAIYSMNYLLYIYFMLNAFFQGEV